MHCCSNSYKDWRKKVEHSTHTQYTIQHFNITTLLTYNDFATWCTFELLLCYKPFRSSDATLPFILTVQTKHSDAQCISFTLHVTSGQISRRSEVSSLAIISLTSEQALYCIYCIPLIPVSLFVFHLTAFWFIFYALVCFMMYIFLHIERKRSLLRQCCVGSDIKE